MSISGNINKILNEIPNDVKLVAVSKTIPNKCVMEAYNGDYKIFGENRVQALVQRHNDLPKDIEWHMIGHLQTNKVKYIAPFVHLIHSVDSIRLLKEINKQAYRNDRKINCLLQFHIAHEETKFGFTFDEVEKILISEEFHQLKALTIAGVMGMASFTDNKEQIRLEFRNLKNIFNKLKQNYFVAKDDFREISMGMSGDYDIAIEEGSTIIRVGSSIFGARSSM